jgi:hypothetical protein
VSDCFTKHDHDPIKFKRGVCVSISLCSLHPSYGNYCADYDCFKMKFVYVDAHKDQAQSYFFWFTVVVDSRLCPLYCRIPVCMIDSSNVLWFCPYLKGTSMCLSQA